ncbi:hemerythrin family protein [Campylobacter upsaliensis]|uniref:hemerythrin family protein n=1 Tax=Campylobacter upsaliensis TaxID=28080 RepID=UPI002B3AB7C3|nr:hemerythrin family protein [Campylobacter upsaliensis]MEB2833472.1 hemerythrin family protein [Campylobacter upsaliensis]
MNKKIEWNKEFNINNYTLDKQHELIFDITNCANELAKKVLEHYDDSLQEELKKTIVRLFDYIKIHFKDEEAYMKEIDYPLLEEHKEAHRVLVEKTKELLNYSKNPQTFAKELASLTRDWISKHFCVDDKWIDAYRYKAIHLNEVHFSLETYKTIKALRNPAIEKEECFKYLCVCEDKIHQVPRSIHEELMIEKSLLKCETCEQILIYLGKEEGELKSLKDLEQEFEMIGKSNV